MVDSGDRIHVFQGLQQDKAILDKMRKTTAIDGFDIIIDDALHIGELTSLSFWYLFDYHLKPGGIYVIEDWRTGYWGRWPDGKQYSFRKIDLMKGIRNFIDVALDKIIKKNNNRRSDVLVRKILRILRDKMSKRRLKSHDYGMVGFIKQLIDELDMDMITNPERGSKIPFRNCKFSKIEIFPGLVFIVNSPDTEIQKI